jgi:deoxyribodipyrimidine photo-lyase
LREDGELRAAVDRAAGASTGVDCLDVWTRELIDTGWLHNHARMWFASIWIFTLNLPWQLGADFFYKHLLDADPASNTLSWRWVAGLHTRGKHYLARAANIREYTLGRFDPRGQLNETAGPLRENAPPTPAAALAAHDAPREPQAALLIHTEDLHPESLAFETQIVGVGCLRPAPVGDPSGPAARFEAGAAEDGLARAARCWNAPQAPLLAGTDEIAAWARALGVKEVVTPYAPVGPTAFALSNVAQRLNEDGVRLVSLRRAFDSRAWPYATAGFFRLREAIPTLVAASGPP